MFENTTYYVIYMDLYNILYQVILFTIQCHNSFMMPWML